MHSMYHAKSSVHKWGGALEDYVPIHNFIDQSKTGIGDVRHRAILHHTVGCQIAEQHFGVFITNSDGKDIPVREIVERHIVEDLGFLPTPKDWLKCISLKAIPWAGGHVKALKRKGIPISNEILKRCSK